MSKKTIFRIPHKATISGEFSCVFGHPVITTTIPLYIEVTLATEPKSKPDNITIITSDKETITFGLEDDIKTSLSARLFTQMISHLQADKQVETYNINIEFGKTDLISFGLGSSANFLIALFICASEIAGQQSSDKEWLVSNFHFLKSLEDQFHGKSSGIDVLTILRAEFNIYTKKETEWVIPYPAEFQTHFWMLLIKSNKTKNTKASIADLLKQLEEQPKLTKSKIDSIGQNTLDLFENLVEEKEFGDLYKLIDNNQRLIKELGLSDPSIDNIVDELATIGLASKLTGGGRGGCVLALIPQSEYKKFFTIIQEKFASSYIVYWFDLNTKKAPGIERLSN